VTGGERVLDNLGGALRKLLAGDPRLYLLGEDIADPYGGAFKVTSGLSSEYPERVLATPISESGIVGVANGLALAGNRVIAEIMFGDFAGLCFDQILNMSAKSVSMYGRRLDMPLIVRCPVGGNRGYGPTHSQSLHKHFIGIPDLVLAELSAVHDNLDVLGRLLDGGRPALFFENKTVYAERFTPPGPVDDLFRTEYLDDGRRWARLTADGGRGSCLLITAGGVLRRALEAARRLLLEHELDVTIVTTAQLYPFAAVPIGPDVARADHVFVVEEGAPGGTWGDEVARCLYEEFWDRLRYPVGTIHSRDGVIPAARHLERRVVVQADDIVRRVAERAAACR
jgi:pyruvate/2-oxoglutarate/acetoin dehydrogenase E1 component